MNTLRMVLCSGILLLSFDCFGAYQKWCALHYLLTKEKNYGIQGI